MSEALTIRVYGDSLGLPRSQSGVAPEDTYSELIRRELSRRRGSDVVMYNRSQGGADIRTLFAGYSADAAYFGKSTGLLIVQCGVVDCAPRPVPPVVKYRVIAKLPGRARTGVIAFLHNNRARIFSLGFQWRSTPPRQFLEVYARWLLTASEAFGRIYLVNILPTTGALEQHSPGLSASIDLYNQLIREAVVTAGVPNVRLIDACSAARQAGVIGEIIDARDGHHLTAAGHRFLSQLICEGERSPAAIDKPAQTIPV